MTIKIGYREGDVEFTQSTEYNDFLDAQAAMPALISAQSSNTNITEFYFVEVLGQEEIRIASIDPS